MAVIRCQEVPLGRSGGDDYQGNSRYTRVWQVETDNDADGPPTVLAATDIPPVGFPYINGAEWNHAAKVKSRDPAQQDDPRVWLVTVSYETRFSTNSASGGGSGTPGEAGKSPEQRPANPLDRPVVWNLDFIEEQEAVLRDKDGKAYKNSAGLYFDPPYMKTVIRPQFTAVKNYANFTYLNAANYFNKVNGDTWYGFTAKRVKAKLKLQSMYENGYGFVQANWIFTVNMDGWNPTLILDKGPYYLSGGIKKTFLDAFQQPIEGNLDGSGNDFGLAEYYIQFRNYDEISFAAIP